jgi:hypothetical protein
MAKKLKALIVMNKANKQINLTLPKKQTSKQMLNDLKKSKRVEIDLTKFYPE